MDSHFSGSYDPQDVCFLLKPVQMEYVAVLEKERRIQSGESHYSEMLGAEQLPSSRYTALFNAAMQRNAHRFAMHILQLAGIIVRNMEQKRCAQITLVSLARAGTPVGVLLKRSLGVLGRQAAHYSISIIRDRGIDEEALRYILEREGRNPQGLVFVDGWTGKGVIGAELKKAIGHFNDKTGLALPSHLHVVADLCGAAEVSATGDDYLIPSSLLNAIISGLVSRSVLNSRVVGPGDFHACVYHEHWHAEDKSRWFVDEIFDLIRVLAQKPFALPSPLSHGDILEKQRRSVDFLNYCRQTFGVENANHIKPGIGEATRVLLRRVPHTVLLRAEDQDDTQHILLLAREKAVPVHFVPHLPYAAAALIRTLYGE